MESKIFAIIFLVVVTLTSSFTAAEMSGKRQYKEQSRPYSFSYGIKDSYAGNDYERSEVSDGDHVTGSYTVQLPDGRKQTVKYVADHNKGFVADVSYHGEAKYPPPHKHEHGSYLPPHNQEHGSYLPPHKQEHGSYLPPHKQEHGSYLPPHKQEHGSYLPPHKQDHHGSYLPPHKHDEHDFKYGSEFATHEMHSIKPILPKHKPKLPIHPPSGFELESPKHKFQIKQVPAVHEQKIPSYKAPLKLIHPMRNPALQSHKPPIKQVHTEYKPPNYEFKSQRPHKPIISEFKPSRPHQSFISNYDLEYESEIPHKPMFSEYIPKVPLKTKPVFEEYESEIPHKPMFTVYNPEKPHKPITPEYKPEVPHKPMFSEYKPEVPHMPMFSEHISEVPHKPINPEYKPEVPHMPMFLEYKPEAPHMPMFSEHISEVPHKPIIPEYKPEVPHMPMFSEHISEVPHKPLPLQHESDISDYKPESTLFEIVDQHILDVQGETIYAKVKAKRQKLQNFISENIPSKLPVNEPEFLLSPMKDGIPFQNSHAEEGHKIRKSNAHLKPIHNLASISIYSPVKLPTKNKNFHKDHIMEQVNFDTDFRDQQIKGQVLTGDIPILPDEHGNQPNFDTGPLFKFENQKYEEDFKFPAQHQSEKNHKYTNLNDVNNFYGDDGNQNLRANFRSDFQEEGNEKLDINTKRESPAEQEQNTSDTSETEIQNKPQTDSQNESINGDSENKNQIINETESLKTEGENLQTSNPKSQSNSYNSPTKPDGKRLFVRPVRMTTRRKRPEENKPVIKRDLKTE